MQVIRPNPGAQEQFLQSTADFVIYGGGRGGGKTWALLLEVVRYHHIPGFTAVIFRKTYPQIEASGGLWEKSTEIFPHIGGKANRSNFKWTFPSGATCRFRHLSDDKDLLNVQGAEICYIGLDELTHFSWKMVNTLFAANRSTCGVEPFIRGTCNPDPNSWVAEAIAPWLREDGFPDQQVSGKLKTFKIENNQIRYVEPGEEKEEEEEGLMSLTFIPALVHDNPRLLEKDPRYIQRLKSMQLVERERFLMGNWKIKAEAGTIFQRQWFELDREKWAVEFGDRLVRYWDLAATTHQNAKRGDWTVGLLIHFRKRHDDFVVKDVVRRRLPPAQTNQLIQETAAADGKLVQVRWQQDPGAAGVRDSVNLQAMLKGYDARGIPEIRDKVSRALPVSYMAEQGKIKLTIAPWNREFLSECEQFPEGKHDDMVDSLSGAFNCATLPIVTPNKKVRY